MLKKILLLTIAICFIGYANALTDTAAVKKDTVMVKDTLTKKAISKIDSTVLKKDTIAKTGNPIVVQKDTVTAKKIHRRKICPTIPLVQ